MEIEIGKVNSSWVRVFVGKHSEIGNFEAEIGGFLGSLVSPIPTLGGVEVAPHVADNGGHIP